MSKKKSNLKSVGNATSSHHETWWSCGNKNMLTEENGYLIHESVCALLVTGTMLQGYKRNLCLMKCMIMSYAHCKMICLLQCDFFNMHLLCFFWVDDCVWYSYYIREKMSPGTVPGTSYQESLETLLPSLPLICFVTLNNLYNLSSTSLTHLQNECHNAGVSNSSGSLESDDWERANHKQKEWPVTSPMDLCPPHPSPPCQMQHMWHLLWLLVGRGNIPVRLGPGLTRADTTWGVSQVMRRNSYVQHRSWAGWSRQCVQRASQARYMSYTGQL